MITHRSTERLSRLNCDKFLAPLAGSVLLLAMNAGCRLTAWMAMFPGSGVTLWETASAERDTAVCARGGN